MSHLNRKVPIRAVTAVLVAAMALVTGPAGIAMAEPVPYQTLGVSLLVQSHGSGAPLLLISAVLPDETPLPAEVALPVPAGSEVVWAGEIIGQTIEEDIEVEAVIQDGEFGSVAVFTVTTSRLVQVEVTYSGAVVSGEGGASLGTFALAAPVAAESARLAIALPPGGSVTEIPEGLLVAAGPDNYTYYYKDLSPVAAGDLLELDLGFAISATPQPAAPPMSAPSSELPPLLVVLIAAAIGGALLMLLASRARRTAGSFDEDAAAVSAPVSEDAFLSDDGPEMAAAAFEPAAAEPPALADAAVDSEPVAAEPVTAPAPFLTPKMLVIIAAVLVLGVFLVLNTTGQSSQIGVIDISDGSINQRISAVDAVQQVDYQLRISCDCPPEAEAPKIFEVLRLVPGVATASLQQATLVLRVGYDPSLTDEAAIATALRSKGYLP